MLSPTKIFSQNKKTLFLIGLGLFFILFPSQWAESQDEGAYFYRGAYYELQSLFVGPGEGILDLNTVFWYGGDWRGEISSLEIIGDYSAWLYSSSIYGNYEICFTDSVNHLGAYDIGWVSPGFFISPVPMDWNDMATSLKVLTAAACISPGVTQKVAAEDPWTWCEGCDWTHIDVCVNCIVQWLFSIPIRVAFLIPVVFIGIFGLLAGVIFSAATALMNWIMGAILEVGITPANPVTPEVVNIGWTFSRDLVNMLFILILVFVGLATILKLREYETKKILPLLIIIALLINFSYVIVGFIVDISNIVTKFFFDRVGELTNIGDVFINAGEYLGDSMITIFRIDGHFFENFGEAMGEILGVLAYGIVLLIFYGFAALIYFVIILLFFARVIFLWILTILAPLAFACYVLPATKRWWNEWWHQLVLWSIIGIPIGFFLILSNLIMRAGPALEEAFNTGGLSDTLVGTGEPILSNLAVLITSLLVPSLALILLFVGVLLSLRFAPSGSSGIISFGTRKGKEFGQWARYRGKAFAEEKVPESWRRWGQRQAEVPTPGAVWGKGEPGMKGYGKRFAGTLVAGVTSPYWATRRGIGRAISLGAADEMKDEERLEKEILEKAKTPEEKLRRYRVAGTRAEKIAALRAMKEAEQIDDAKKLGLKDKEIIATAREAAVLHPDVFSKIRDAFPQLADEIAEKLGKTVRERAKLTLTPEDEEKYGSLAVKITARIKAGDISKVDETIFKNLEKYPGVRKAIHQFWSGEQIGAAGRRFTESFLKPFQEGVDKIGIKWYEEQNPRQLRYLESSAARALGIKPPERGEAPREKLPDFLFYKAPPPEKKKPPRTKRPRGWPGPGVETPGEKLPRETIERLRRERRPRGWRGPGV